MPTRTGKAVWKGSLKEGKGEMETESGVLKNEYSFGTRFQQKKGTNPDELIAAAHAGCFSMALSLILGQEGYTPTEINTTAKVTIEEKGGGFALTTSKLITKAKVPNIEENEFQKIANKAKKGCPVSKALKGLKIELDAKII